MTHLDQERQAAFERAVEAVLSAEPLTADQQDALSMIEGGNVQAFREAFRRLPAPARARLVQALQGRAEERLHVDFSGVNHVALDDEDADVRLAAVNAAVEDRSPALLDLLLETVQHDPSPTVRQAAAEDLARFVLLGELEDLDPASVARIRERLLARVHDESEESPIRNAALAALGYFSDDAIQRELGSAFGNPSLRLGAVRGMGRSADPRWTDRLMPVLGSEDPRMREEAAHALGEIEDERAVGALADMVDDPELEVRLAVIWALGEIGGDAAREALLYALEAPKERVREAAERAITSLEEKEEPVDAP